MKIYLTDAGRNVRKWGNAISLIHAKFAGFLSQSLTGVSWMLVTGRDIMTKLSQVVKLCAAMWIDLIGRWLALQIQTREPIKVSEQHYTFLNGLDRKWQMKALCTSITRKATKWLLFYIEPKLFYRKYLDVTPFVNH